MHLYIKSERVLQHTILHQLERGRPGWDRPHTVAVVAYAKAIMAHHPELRLDPDVMVIAAYCHDWGYAGLFIGGEPAGYAAVQDQKAGHMRLGAEMTAELLTSPAFSHLSPAQKSRIVHLVAVHDKVPELTETDELVLMEADTLGAADCHAVTPTFNREDNDRWLAETRRKRISRFITDFSRSKIEELFLQRDEYYATISTA